MQATMLDSVAVKKPVTTPARMMTGVMSAKNDFMNAFATRRRLNAPLPRSTSYFFAYQ